ncbi:hypothetical protein FDECE_4673 [Fusarium decemcellulare]|nr:hypothetical protein FDECE_4673 [Fusarium decemcellulare]
MLQRISGRDHHKHVQLSASKGQKLLGLAVWYDGGAAAEVDIVFVHGLMGDRHKTWRGTDSKGVKLEPWPKLLLSKDVPKSRIMTFGYDARVINKDSASGRLAAESASEHARELVHALRDYRCETKTMGRHIIFVCHSLGGIAMCFSYRRSTQDYHDVWKSTAGIIFMGTPHRGSKQSRTAMTAASFLGIFMDTNINLLEILNESCGLRDRIDEEFHALQESRKIRTDCFWEALPSKRGGIIVPKESATLGGDRGRAIHADHSNMVKFSSATDEGYKAVRSTLKEMIDVAARATHKSQPELPRRPAATTIGTANKPRAWFISVSRNQFFSGRESELDKLSNCLGLHTSEHGRSHTRAAIWGVGGIGKTQIAMQWVTSIHERNNISVFWVHGGSIDRFVDSYTKIARCCEIPGCDVDDPQLSQHDMLHKVNEWLESEAQRCPWVMVVDNVDDINVLRQTIDLGTSQITIESFLPRPVNGSILFTTRSKETASALADPANLVMVDEMTPQGCVELMRTRSPLNKHEDKDLRELATELGYLPLALIQGTAYLANKEDSVAEYLQRLKQARRLVPEQPPEDEISVLRDEEGRYSAVARTLMVTFEAIESENSLATELLRLAGFYERQEVSRSLFINFAERYELCSIGIFVLGPEWDGWEATGRVTCPTIEEVNEALSLLESYSVLTKDRDEGAVTMHRLVHLVLRNQAKGNRPLAREVAAKAMTTMCYTFPVPNADKWMEIQRLMPHAKAVVSERDMKLDTGLAINSKFRLLTHMTEFLKANHEPIDGLEGIWNDLVKNMEEVIGPYHNRTLQAKLDVVRFFQPGDGDKVKVLVAEIQEKLGDGRLPAKTSLASILFRCGHLEEAASLLDSFIDEAFRSDGSAGNITHTAVWYRARVFASLGQLEEALALIRERLRVQGHEKAEFAVARLTWFAGNLTAAAGNDDEALGLWAIFWHKAKSLWGDDHSITLEHRGDFERAKECIYSGRSVHEDNLEVKHYKEAADKRKSETLGGLPETTSTSVRVTNILNQYSKGQMQLNSLAGHDWRRTWSWTLFPALKQDWATCKLELEAAGFDIGPPLQEAETRTR